MKENEVAFNTIQCWRHGRALKKLGLCVLCINEHNPDSDDALEAIALQQLEVQRTAAPDIAA